MPFFDQYPYTNFHNVNLDWVLERVKDWGALVEQNNTAFHDLEEANENFKNYVTSYLENLDVQEEINNKLDSMLESGVLTEYLQPYISEDVSSWLEENITEPTGVVIDKSLTVSGACADAKVTGDKIRNLDALKDEIDDINHTFAPLLDNTHVLFENVINGFADSQRETVYVSRSPFVYNLFTPNKTVNIDSLYLNIFKTGNLSIGKILKTDVIPNRPADITKAIILHTFTIEGVGVQTLQLNQPIPVETNYYFFVGYPTDTAGWYYGPSGTDKGFLRVGNDNYWTNSVYGLGIIVKCVDIEINFRTTIKSIYYHKKISFYGDSITTYNGYIPEGQPTYYPSGDVTSVNDTWWMKVVNAFESVLDINNSWSGCRVTVYNNQPLQAGCMNRTSNLGNPDIIIIYMGINDFNNNVPLGDYNGKTAIPDDVSTFASAYAIMLNKILTNYKSAKVYACTLPIEERVSTGFPEVNENGVSLAEWNDKIKKIANIFNVEVLDIAKCGLTYQNMNVYNPNLLHPNKRGHSLIANYIINKLDNAVSIRYD